MSDMIKKASDQVRELVMKALGECVAEGVFPAEPIPSFNVEIPADPKNGDLSTNAAMVCARAFRSAPRKIGEEILHLAHGNEVETVLGLVRENVYVLVRVLFPHFHPHRVTPLARNRQALLRVEGVVESVDEPADHFFPFFSILNSHFDSSFLGRRHTAATLRDTLCHNAPPTVNPPF